MKYIKAIFLIIILILAVVVSVQNYNEQCLDAPVIFRVNLLLFEYQTAQIPLGCLVVVSLMIGVLSMGFLGIVERFRLKKQVRVLMKEIKEREKELHSIKTMAVTTEIVTPEQTSEML